MHRLAAYVVLCAALASAQPDSNADDVLNRVRARMKDHLARLPSYTCAQTIQRTQRASRDANFQLKDTVRLEVALIAIGWLRGIERASAEAAAGLAALLEEDVVDNAPALRGAWQRKIARLPGLALVLEASRRERLKAIRLSNFLGSL